MSLFPDASMHTALHGLLSRISSSTPLYILNGRMHAWTVAHTDGQVFLSKEASF